MGSQNFATFSEYNVNVCGILLNVTVCAGESCAILHNLRLCRDCNEIEIRTYVVSPM